MISNRDLDKIYKQTLGYIYRYVYSHVGNTATTEDIVSETYMTFVEIYEKYDGKSKVTTFLIGIARNKMRQHWDKQKKNGSTELDENFYIKPDNGYDEEEDEAKYNLLKGLLTEVLDALPDNYKSVLVARFIDCLNIKETAAELEITEGNVRVIQNRALKKACQIANELQLTKTNE